MPVTNTTLLDVYAVIAERTYLETEATPDISAGSLGTYEQIVNQSLNLPTIDGPLGFQARAFFNSTNDELVIAFTGTEGFSDVNAPEFLPDFLADFGLAILGASPQDIAAQAFVQQAITAAQIEVGPFGSFDVTYVGHSLGGFLAQIASTSGDEGDVVVFNSPGAGGFLGLPSSGSFPQDNYTYVYSDPSQWDLISGAIHSVGYTLSDNIFYVPGSTGHALNKNDGTGLSDVLDETTSLASAGGEIFLPIDEAVQLLGAAAILDSYVAPAVNGSSSAEELLGTGAADEINGLGGDDTIEGNNGNDTLIGGDGDDSIRGNKGADYIEGGAGNDSLFGGNGFDTLDGGIGNDSVYGGNGRDTVILGEGNDRFIDIDQTGELSWDFVLGNEGNDTLVGLGGNDTLIGGIGEDQIEGGRGNDSLKGGQDQDTFIYNGNFRTGADVIEDFTLGEDSIELQNLTESEVSISTSSDGTVISWMNGEGTGSSITLLNGVSIMKTDLDFV